jgi:RND family efflux transporter MFP subunit
MGMPSMFDQFFTRNAGSMMGYGNPWLERTADLYSQGTAISQSQNQILEARSKLEEADARLRDTRAISPFAGVIVKKHVEMGDTVQVGQPLLTFADTRFLQIKVDVPARLVSGLNKGMIVPAKLDVGDTHVNTRVAQIFPIADPTRHTVTVKFDLPQGVPGGPGMYAEVMVPDVNVPDRVLPVIPMSSVVWRGSLPAVFVLTKEGRTELRLIRLGEKVDTSTILVLSGLSVGENIHVNPPAGMASGWSGGSQTDPRR